MFATLETTELATWVAVSLWGYPFMLSLHVMGLAVVVGIFSMRDLSASRAISWYSTICVFGSG